MKLPNAGHLKPYPEMKNSGIEWLGEIPEQWSLLPPKRVLRPEASGVSIIKNTASGEYKIGYVPAFSASGQDIWLPAASHHGDALVLSAVGARCGKTFRTSGDWGVVANTQILRPRKTQNRDFWWYVTNSPDWWERAGAAQPFVRVSSTLNRTWAIPPLPEQTAIVRFLDHADRRIRRYIRAKQKLIALLEEQKQAIIHQAVTGQIDIRTGEPYPAYRPSGVEWLGDVPEDWEVVPLRRVTLDSCDGPFGSGLKSSHYTEEGIRVVRLQNIGHGEFKDSDAAFISSEHYSSLGDHSVISGDVLIAGLGDNNHPAGRACVAPENIIPAMVKADCFRFRLNQTRIQPRFAALQLTATAPVTSALLSTGATRQRTNLQATSGRAIGIPSVPEQNLIVKYITAEVSGIGGAQVAVQREIDLLHEYRTRLIADVVTGKLDVREAAAELPEVDPLAEDDLDGTIHDRENSNPDELDAEKSAEEYTIEKEVTV